MNKKDKKDIKNQLDLIILSTIIFYMGISHQYLQLTQPLLIL